MKNTKLQTITHERKKSRKKKKKKPKFCTMLQSEKEKGKKKRKGRKIPYNRKKENVGVQGQFCSI